MSSLPLIHPHLQSGSSTLATQNDCSVPQMLVSGSTDGERCGIVPGTLIQLCAGSGVSSGRTALLFSVMAQLTRRHHFCALVDAADRFDPVSAGAAGVKLNCVLWVRCGQSTGADRHNALNPLEQAFKAADILVQSGGFGLIAVDLSNIEERRLRKVPLTTWFRFARVAEKMQTTLMFLTSYPAAHSCADLTLHMNVNKARWSENTAMHRIHHSEPGQASERVVAQALESAECNLEIGRMRKPVQPVKPKFTAMAMWK